MAYLLAHLSDPHLGPMPLPRPPDLIGKRAIGYLNWQRTRHAIHRREVLAALVSDIHAHKPDHIAITGDLVNIALPAEFVEARAWLKTVGTSHDVSVVPGNHDTYARRTRHHFAHVWSDFLRGDAADTVAFPYVRRRGPLVLIGASSAVPTAPFMATGRLGRAQRDALDRTLARLADNNLFRVLLIHHPLHTAPGRWAARLRDADDILNILSRRGVDLVLHGHDHRHSIVWFDGPQGKIPAIGVPSSSVIAGGHQDPAAYNLFSIDRDDGGWRVTQTVRGFGRDDANGVIEIEKRVLGLSHLSPTAQER